MKATVVVEVVVATGHVACHLCLGDGGRVPLELSRLRLSVIFEHVADHDNEEATKVRQLPPIHCFGPGLDGDGLPGSRLVLENGQEQLTSWVAIPRIIGVIYSWHTNLMEYEEQSRAGMDVTFLLCNLSNWYERRVELYVAD